MLIIFKTPAYADLTYLGDVAMELIRLMGHSGSVPGALAAEDVPGARARLQEAMASRKGEAPSPAPQSEESADDDVAPIPLRHRAGPLLELLRAAESGGVHVLWEQG